MARYVFDIEANGFEQIVTNVWCIVLKDIDTQTVDRFPPESIQEGLRVLADADALIGHNIIGYDLRVLQKLFGFKPKPG